MIKAKISAIEQNDGVSVFEFSAENLSLKMLSLENLQNLKIGDEVWVGFKSSDVFRRYFPAFKLLGLKQDKSANFRHPKRRDHKLAASKRG